MKPLSCIYFFVCFVLLGCQKEIQPKITEPPADTIIVGWGDSLTEGHGGDGTTYLTTLTALTGLTTYNKGVVNDKSYQIKARMLADTGMHKYPTIIWAGTNNFTDNERIKSDVAEMVKSLGHSHYLVLSVMNGARLHQEKGKPYYKHIIDTNNDLAAIYGDHYIDIRAYLVSQYNPAYPQDVIDYHNDIPPSSLRVSKLHLTAKGYGLVGKKIYTKIGLLLDK